MVLAIRRTELCATLANTALRSSLNSEAPSRAAPSEEQEVSRPRVNPEGEEEEGDGEGEGYKITIWTHYPLPNIMTSEGLGTLIALSWTQTLYLIIQPLNVEGLGTALHHPGPKPFT